MKLEPGATFVLDHTFAPADVADFARLTGDDNPIHTDAAFAATTRFGRPIVHGIFVVAMFARVLGRELPSSGAVYVGQDVRFLAPVFVGDPVHIACTVEELLDKGRVRVRTVASRPDGTVCVDGSALLIAPRPKA